MKAIAAPKPTEQKSAAASTSAGTSKHVEVKVEKKRKLIAEKQPPAKAKKLKRESTVGTCLSLRTTFPFRQCTRHLAESKQQSKASSSKATTPQALTPKTQPHKPQPEASASEGEDGKDQESDQALEDDLDGSDSDEEGDPSKLVHESVAVGSKPKTTSGKVKYVPSEETPEQRDARTVFVGNVPVEVVKSKVCCVLRSISYVMLNAMSYTAYAKAVQSTHPFVRP